MLADVCPCCTIAMPKCEDFSVGLKWMRCSAPSTTTTCGAAARFHYKWPGDSPDWFGILNNSDT